jgi:FkbM family methyltransferase
MGQKELDQISDVDAFYDFFHGDLRPSWFGVPDPNPEERPWALLDFCSDDDCLHEIGGLNIKTSVRDEAAARYRKLASAEAFPPSRWQSIRRLLAPRTVIDIGAHYGFFGAHIARALGARELTSIEADPRLYRFLRDNLSSNLPGCGVEVINAVCRPLASTNSLETALLCPNSTEDRGDAPDFERRKTLVRAIPLSRIIERVGVAGPFFINLNNRGLDVNVIRGSHDALVKHGRWGMRCAFSPDWMKARREWFEAELCWLSESFFSLSRTNRIAC